MKAAQNQDVTSELDYVCSFYENDFQTETLKVHMQLIFSECILKRVGSKESSQRYLISRAILLPCLQHKDPFCLKFVLFTN